jgi:trans-aconitate methyltransferase
VRPAAAWDVERYEGKHAYVWQYGASLIEVLAPQAGERILDLGCGTGHLTAEMASRGAAVVGLDGSPDMLGQARQNYPALTFTLADATSFRFDEPFDAVFSNAALHWVKDAEAAVSSIAQALRPGGRFVAEFGGKGNIAAVMGALNAVFGAEAEARCPWRFMGIGEYSSLLERHGVEVREAHLFDRPTALEGENGLEDWLRMFAGSYFRDLPEERARETIRKIVERLRPALYRDGVWTLDYRRLRVVAIKGGAARH